MSLHLQKDIEKLKKKILAFSALVEGSVKTAFNAYKSQDRKSAAQVMETDIEIDRTEVEIEEDCLKILALHQPVAIDLRFIIAVLKINNDLERIGDLAVNIAEQVAYTNEAEAAELPPDLARMNELTQSMLGRSLEALINLDTDLARKIFPDDDAVDAILDKMYALVNMRVSANNAVLDEQMSLFLVARHLERIADLATNIAEDVIYMIEGKIIRHGGQ